MIKYTVIYSNFWMSGSHRHALTLMDRIETEDLDKTIRETDKYDTNVWFVFKGWPELAEQYAQVEETHETT